MACFRKGASAHTQWESSAHTIAHHVRLWGVNHLMNAPLLFREWSLLPFLPFTLRLQNTVPKHLQKHGGYCTNRSANIELAEWRCAGSQLPVHFGIKSQVFGSSLPCVIRFTGWKFRKTLLKTCVSVRGRYAEDLQSFGVRGAPFSLLCACARLSHDTERNSHEPHGVPVFFDGIASCRLYHSKIIPYPFEKP